MQESQAAPAAPTLRPVAACFACFGVFWGSWAVAALDVQRFLRLSDGGLGLLLAVTVVGGAGANAIGGTLAERHGTRLLLGVGIGVWGGLILSMAALENRPAFEVVFIATVAAGGLVDVTMNVAATAGVTSSGRLLRFHALFNIGSVAGAGITGLLLAADVSWRGLWATIGAAGLVLAVLCLRADLPAGARGQQHTIREGLASLRRSRLLPLAMVFAFGAVVEGGIGTWGVLYLRARLETAALAGAAAYVAGQALATVARVTLAPAADRLGERRAARLGTALACAGLLVEITAGRAWLAGIGLAAAAVGISIYWPVLLSMAGRGSDRPGVVVGGVSAAGYLGFVAGPPVVGWVAGIAGLRGGMAVLVVAAFLATVLPVRSHGPARPSAHSAMPTG